MPISISEENGGRRFWRRTGARSLDLSGTSSDDCKEGSKAAAWIWHMHMSTSARNYESPVHHAEWRASDTSTKSSWEEKRRSSGSSSDRKDSRFRREATNVISSSPLNTAASSTVWDCGSNLYDTFELVSFSNRLDRSLLSVPVLDALSFHPVQSPSHHARALRTLSSPSIPSSQISSATATAAASMGTTRPPEQVNDCHELSASDVNRPCRHENVEHVSIRHVPRSSVVHGLVTTTKSKSSCASQAFFAKCLTKIVKIASFHGKMCFKANVEREETIAEPRTNMKGSDEGGVKLVEQEQAREWEWEWEQERDRMYKEKPKLEGHTHFHYHHHHHHHHFLHQSNHSGTYCAAESQLQLLLNEH